MSFFNGILKLDGGYHFQDKHEPSGGAEINYSESGRNKKAVLRTTQCYCE